MFFFHLLGVLRLCPEHFSDPFSCSWDGGWAESQYILGPKAPNQAGGKQWGISGA